MKPPLYITLVAAVLGYFVGSAGVISQENDPAAGHDSLSSSNNGGGTSRAVIESTIESADTVATLSELPATELYDRLALWLLDASPSDMQGFWNEYALRDDHTNDLNDLVFINWTRIDPEAAIAASTGTKFAHYPWWAWACHEPQKALKEVLARYDGKKSHDRIGEVMWGLGEFHPEWLREHIDELPEKWMRDRALSGYTKWADTENPRESIEFLTERGWNIDKKTLTAFALESPLEAYQLALDLKGNGNYRNQSLPDQLLDSLAEREPALLDELLTHSKSPQGKMKIQLKQFDALLKSDLVAAKEKVDKMPDSWVKQDLLAKMGKHYLKTNPPKAIEIATRIFRSNNDPIARYSYIFRENGSSGSGVSNAIVKELRDELVKSQPEKFINSLLPEEGESNGNYYSVATAWASHDLPAYADWVTKQEDPEIYKAAAKQVVEGLTKKAHYEEAMEWAGSISNESESKQYSYEISRTYEKWLRSDLEAARAWKQNATLNELTFERLQKLEERHQEQ